MKFSSVLFVLSTLTFSTALPVTRRGFISGLAVREGNSTLALFSNSTSSSTSSISSSSAKPTTEINLESLKEDAAAKKATSVSGFANDANTVSAALNKLPSMTDRSDIASLAGKAFNAESDEDSQRSVLFAAAGSAGSSANSKIVKNTPAVLKGLKAIMVNPSIISVKYNVATIEAARNPNILPSITQLSNAALSAMNLAPTARKFPATGQY
ncbi:5021df08-1055-48ba-8e99-08c9ff303ca4 [Sclerotinia trifoliorum]|uniref:5021df08-1055-48ba-8e99-08c9ff303ca4 n=1 Tax=Sclerotinia trifoliorum TaxID=28548 RepID=A0A8H2W2I0_9HELO|nr:5021df08-1055-48ba-8e99-08c9ff303ca4 [Sclerotinia trifoliorum]